MFCISTDKANVWANAVIQLSMESLAHVEALTRNNLLGMFKDWNGFLLMWSTLQSVILWSTMVQNNI